MDRETAITRALGAFWQEIEKLYPQSFYEGLSAETFNRLREAAAAAVAERLEEAGHTVSDTEPPPGLKHFGLV